MRLLVTGCAGFIGSAVTRLLVGQGHTVVGLDNLNDAYDVRLKEWRLAQLHQEPAFAFHLVDIAKRDELGRVFHGEKLDAVVNLAARAGVRQSLECPELYWETNVTGTLHLLELCRKMGVGKFVQASSSSVYGDGKRPFQEEASEADRPLSPYAATKRASELLCYSYHRSYGLDISVLRYFTVYGPGGRPDMSALRFVKWITEGEPVIVFGDGSQERDFTYVKDIARGTAAALAPVEHQIINLGSDRPVPLHQMVGLLEDIIGRKARIEHLPRHEADVSGTWADIARARELLGWRPEVSLEDGMRHTVRWYMENREWARSVVA